MSSYLNFSNELMKNIVSSINMAVTDNIISDLHNACIDKRNSNSYFQRIWDYINRNINNIPLKTLTTGYSQRGPWKFISLFDNTTGTIYTIMREQRFADLSRGKNKHVHYMQALADYYNVDIDFPQQTLIEMEINQQEVNDAVTRICSNLNVPKDIIDRHVLILFEAKNEILIDIRCCVINGFFDICEEVNLREYININEPIIIDEIIATESKYNNPTQGLKFTNKAKTKKNTTDSVAIKKELQKSNEIG